MTPTARHWFAAPLAGLAVLVSLNAILVRAAEAPATTAAPRTSFKFQFGTRTGSVAPGFTLVPPGTEYSAERGYGFDPGAEVKGMALDDAPFGTLITSDKPFFFSVALPEGNYLVTVALGGAPTASETTVYAELRRLMLQQVRTAPLQFKKCSFVVNVRQAKISTGGVVRVTDREKGMEARAWDDRLTLEFNGTQPSVASLEITKVDVPTLFLIGDSTVCDQPREPYNSWGQMITRFFKPEIAVANHAESGESVAGAVGKHRFDKIWSQMKKGDYLIVQFGHNDMKSTATNALEMYGNNLRKVVDEARQHGGFPILCTPVSRRSFDDAGKISNSFRGYPDAVRQVAKEKNVPLIDLQAMGAAFYEAMGPDASHRAFANARENTHHSDYGSYEIAQCVLQGIKQNKPDLAAFISDDFKGFDPSHPDPFESFKVPASPIATDQTPPGN